MHPTPLDLGPIGLSTVQLALKFVHVCFMIRADLVCINLKTDQITVELIKFKFDRRQTQISPLLLRLAIVARFKVFIVFGILSFVVFGFFSSYLLADL